MKPRDWGALSLVTQLGFTVVTALVLSLLLGLWLDGVLGTRPILTLAFAMLGILIGTVGVYRLITRAIAESVATLPRPKPPADGDARARSPKPDPWADAAEGEDRDGEDDWDRDPWRDEDADEQRRAERDEAWSRPSSRPAGRGPTSPSAEAADEEGKEQ